MVAVVVVVENSSFGVEGKTAVAAAVMDCRTHLVRVPQDTVVAASVAGSVAVAVVGTDTAVVPVLVAVLVDVVGSHTAAAGSGSAEVGDLALLPWPCSAPSVSQYARHN